MRCCDTKQSYRYQLKTIFLNEKNVASPGTTQSAGESRQRLPSDKGVPSLVCAGDPLANDPHANPERDIRHMHTYIGLSAATQIASML